MLMTVEKVYEIEDDMTKANMTDLLHAPLEDESRLGVLTQEQLFCRKRHRERYYSSGPISWRSILFLPSVAFPRRALFHSTRALEIQSEVSPRRSNGYIEHVAPPFKAKVMASDGQPSTLQTLHQFATLDAVWSHTQFTLRCCLGSKHIRSNPSRLILQILGPRTGSRHRRRPTD
jgi:hypothetical protein